MNVRDTDEYIKNMLGIVKEELPVQEKEQIPSIKIEEPKTELPKSEISMPVPSIEIPKVESGISTIPVDRKEEKQLVETPKIDDSNKIKEENPNVYEQSNNVDFVNISSLEQETIPSPVKSALSGLNIVSTDSEIFEGSNISVEEKEEPMQNIEIPSTNNNLNSIDKIKLATAIKLAKDSLEEIRKAGYNATIEELDSDNEYKIIIKVEK